MVNGHVWNMFDEETKYKLYFEHETLSPTLQQWQCFLKISEIAGDWKVRYGRQELGSTTGVVGRYLDPKCMLNIYHFCLNRKCGLLHFLYPFVISSLFLPQQEPERRQGFDPTRACSTFFFLSNREAFLPFVLPYKFCLIKIWKVLYFCIFAFWRENTCGSCDSVLDPKSACSTLLFFLAHIKSFAPLYFHDYLFNAICSVYLIPLGSSFCNTFDFLYF